MFVLFSNQFLGLRFYRMNQRGQGLIEYLIIVALVGVVSMGVMRVIGQNVKARFGHVSAALGAKTQPGSLDSLDEGAFKKNDLSNFFKGSKSNRSGSSGGGDEQ